MNENQKTRLRAILAKAKLNKEKQDKAQNRDLKNLTKTELIAIIKELLS